MLSPHLTNNGARGVNVQLRIDRLNSASPVTIVLFVGLAYALLGALGLTLAIPPGYASPVFPASGFALAFVLWFERRALAGVWLGSLLLNLVQTWLHGTLNPAVFAVTTVIASAAAVQAWAGCRLVNRLQRSAWRDLEREQDAFVFLFLGGVVACLLSASISVTGLRVAGVIHESEYIYTWWNWYVGDTLGVLVFAPLILSLLNRRDEVLSQRRRRIIIPLLLTLGLALFSFYAAARWEKQAQETHLQVDGGIIAKQIADRLITHREVLGSIRNFIETIQDFSFSQFEQFTRISLQDNPDIFALSFNDLISDGQRLSYEQLISGLSPLGSYRITERDRRNALVRAPAQSEYVAVRYIVPLAGNQLAVGFNINSEPVRRDAVKRARISNGMAVTSAIQLVQEPKNRIGILGLMPVKRKSAGTLKDNSSNLLGFAVSVVKVDQMIDIATKGRVPAGMAFKLTDPNTPQGNGLLYRSSIDDAESALFNRAGDWITKLPIGDREWELSVYATKKYRRPWVAWAVGVVGVMFTALLQLLLLGITGRAAASQHNNEAQKAQEVAEAANRTKSAFLASMSHEIRTPLNAILGMTDLLSEALQDKDQVEYLGVVRTAGETLQGLIDDILDFSKIEAGMMRLDIEPFDLQSCIQQVMKIMAVRAWQKNLLLISSEAPGVPDWLAGDSFRLRQILLNLLGNAVKFTEKGSISLKVEKIVTAGDEIVVKFSITDTGIGIQAEKLQTIFDNFSQADTSTTRNYGGSGLGLAISKRLVEMMGGEIGVESTPGQGSCFYFTCRLTVLAKPSPPSAPSQPVENIPVRYLSILLVDDNKDNRTVLNAYFRGTGHRVETAVNGEEAVAKVRQGDYDLVLLDMEMPIMDGYTAVRLIREWERSRARAPLPVIALTANALKEDRQRSLDAGCTDHLTKPILKARLLEVVEKYAAVSSG